MNRTLRKRYEGIKFGSIQKRSTVGYPGLAYTITFLSLLRTFTTCFDRHAPPLRTICGKFTCNQLSAYYKSNWHSAGTLNVSGFFQEQHITLNISGFFQGPLSDLRQPPWSSQVQVPPRNSGNSLHHVHNYILGI